MANAEVLTVMKKDVVDVVTNKVREFQTKGEISFPANYSPENALKSAWLELQTVQDKNQRPALEVCTKDSIANCLLSMVVQGITPAKKQCYFIVYGNQLTLSRSYFGTMNVAKNVRPDIEEIIADVVYQDDVFVYKKVRGKNLVVNHEQALENIDSTKIKCAYATVIYKNGAEESLIMTFEQVKQSWKQSKTRPIDDKGMLNQNSVHAKFTEEMCKRTVINKICKTIINSSDDSNLIIQEFKKSNDYLTESQMREEVADQANKVPLNVDMETGEVIEADYKEVEEQPDIEITDDDIAAEIDFAQQQSFDGPAF